MMNFDDLCKDFDRRRPTWPPIGKTLWFTTKWENGNYSVNDLLRRFLQENGHEYLHTINGDVWFLYQGDWRRCEYDVSDDVVQFYLCEFIDNEEDLADCH